MFYYIICSNFQLTIHVHEISKTVYFSKMDLIHYSFVPLILFHVPYTPNLPPYYLSIANGTGGVGILNFLYFNVLYKSYWVNNKVIDVLYILMYCYVYWNIGYSVTWRVGFVHKFICRKPAVMHTNNQGLTNVYGSVVFHIQHRLVLFLGPSKPQAGSFNR